MPSGQTVASPPLAVHLHDGGAHVIAQRTFAAGDFVLEVHGIATMVPRRYSLQVGADEHLDVPPGLSAAEQRHHHVWSFLDHACEPNARFVGRRLLAIRRIEPGEAVTFHYATTEWAMAEPFRCTCGSAHCLGEVRGFRALPPSERERLRALLAPHLLAKFAST